MAHVPDQTSSSPYGAPTPPPPPPKPSQQPPTSPSLPSYPVHQHQSPIPHPQSYPAPPPPPGFYTASPSQTDNPPYMSTWNAPYPPDEGRRRLDSENSTGFQRQSSYQQPQPQQEAQRPADHYHQQPQQAQFHGQQSQSPPHYQYQQPQEHYQLPASIQAKSITDLSSLLADPELLNAMLNSPETQPSSLKDSTAHLNSHLLANIELAQSLSNLDETLRTARATTSSNLLRLRGLETAWKKKQADLERKIEPWGPRELHQRLGATIAEGDSMCGALEASFIDANARGGGAADEREVTDWVRRVREGRKTVALRRERKRRWDEGRVGGWR